MIAIFAAFNFDITNTRDTTHFFDRQSQRLGQKVFRKAGLAQVFAVFNMNDCFHQL